MGKKKTQYAEFEVGTYGLAPRHFIRLTSNLYESHNWRKLPLSGQAVYIAMLEVYNGNEKHEITVSRRRLAELTGKSLNTVTKGINALIERGFIRRKEFTGGLTRVTSTYKFINDWVMKSCK